MKKSLVSGLGAAILAIAASGIANATIKVDSPTVTSIAGGSSWNYAINGDGQETVVNGQSYFTIYDFAGLITSSLVAPLGWQASYSLVGPTPSNQLVVDNPSIYNITWTFIGLTGAMPPLSPQNGFIAASTDPMTSTTLGTYTYLAFNPGLPNGGSPDQGQGNVITPSAVPEPTSMALVGGGLALVGLARLRRRKS